MAILTSLASIFLPIYSGVRPTIRPATKIARMTNSSMPYMPAPTPPMMISPSWMLISGIIPPSAVKESCMALTAPQDAAVVITANSDDSAMPNRTSLPSILPPAKTQRIQPGCPGCFRPIGDGHAGDEQNAHDGQDGPALPLIADHATEDIGERGTKDEDRYHMDEVGDRAGVFVGMCGIGIEEAAAIGAEMLDHHLRGDWTLRNRLFRALESGGLDIGAEISAVRRAPRGPGFRPHRSAAGHRGCSGSHRPRNCQRSLLMRGQSRVSMQRPAQCRWQLKGSFDASGPASAPDRRVCFRLRNSANRCSR